MKKLILPFCLFLAALSACTDTTTTDATATPVTTRPETPAEADMDDRSRELIGAVETAMGGRAAYEQKPYLVWNFFGKRKTYWDRRNNRVRIEQPEAGSVILYDPKTRATTAYLADTLVTGNRALTKPKEAENIFINDAYWLLLPWKLRDPGVNVRYLGTKAGMMGRDMEVLELTYDVGTGLTPKNKYHIYIDPQTNLVAQWDFYADASDPEPRLTNPWLNYQDYGGILLSGDRGAVGKLTEIDAPASLPDELFTAK